MEKLFSCTDIVELGVQIEKNGKEFYTEVCKRIHDKHAKSVFQRLIQEEEKHIIDFSLILDKVKAYIPKEAYPQEYFEYMNILASKNIFNNYNFEKIMKENLEDPIKDIDFGINFEEQSIEYYESMKKIVPIEEMSLIEELIIQEKEHKRLLQQIKKEM